MPFSYYVGDFPSRQGSNRNLYPFSPVVEPPWSIDPNVSTSDKITSAGEIQAGEEGGGARRNDNANRQASLAGPDRFGGIASWYREKRETRQCTCTAGGRERREDVGHRYLKEGIGGGSEAVCGTKEREGVSVRKSASDIIRIPTPSRASRTVGRARRLEREGVTMTGLKPAGRARKRRRAQGTCSRGPSQTRERPTSAKSTTLQQPQQLPRSCGSFRGCSRLRPSRTDSRRWTIRPKSLPEAGYSRPSSAKRPRRSSAKMWHR